MEKYEDIFVKIQDNINYINNCVDIIKENKFESQKCESDIRTLVIIEATSEFERLFSLIIYDFAIKHSSPIFHKYFYNHFIKKGTNVDPERINTLLKALDIEPIKKEENQIAYYSLKSLYNIRNSAAHGESYEPNLVQIESWILDSFDFFRILINKLF